MPRMRNAAAEKGKRAVEKHNNTLQTLRVEYVPANSIRPNPYNPNRQSEYDFELLVHSIDEDGFTQPIVCQQQSREIVDGEHRWTGSIVHHYLTLSGKGLSPDAIQAARDRRLEIIDPDLLIPVVFVDMTPEQMRISTLRHNRARGSEDVELTAQVLADLEALGALGWAADSLMMSEKELALLLDNIPAPEALASEEFGNAWEPDPIHRRDAEAMSTEVRVMPDTGERKGAEQVQALSAQAVEVMRDRERKITAAKGIEERRMAEQDARFYRLSLIFSGEESDTVKSVLGDHPAERLLAICHDIKQKEGRP